MPPGICKMINAASHALPPDRAAGAPGRRVHDIPQANVLGGGSSVNAQVYMRGRPSDYDAWHGCCGRRTTTGWSVADVLPHFPGMEGNNRLNTSCTARTAAAGLRSRPHRRHVALVRPGRPALGEPYNHDFKRPTQRASRLPSS
jgi:choline dehydrogenase-like flavoprotein